MTWSAPPTVTDGMVLTGAHVMTLVNDLFETSPAKFTGTGQLLVGNGLNVGAIRRPDGPDVVTTGTTDTNSTSYTALTGGPSFSVSTGARAFVFHGALINNDTAGNRSLSSYAVSGASTVAATDTNALIHDVSGTGRSVGASRVVLHTTLTAGTNVFQWQCRVTGGVGTFTQKHLYVFPL